MLLILNPWLVNNGFGNQCVPCWLCGDIDLTDRRMLADLCNIFDSNSARENARSEAPVDNPEYERLRLVASNSSAQCIGLFKNRKNCVSFLIIFYAQIG